MKTITLDSFCKKTGLEKKDIVELVRSKKIPVPVLIGETFLWKESDIDKWLEDQFDLASKKEFDISLLSENVKIRKRIINLIKKNDGTIRSYLVNRMHYLNEIVVNEEINKLLEDKVIKEEIMDKTYRGRKVKILKMNIENQ